MKIVLIGCGKVGITLFYLLKKSNRIVGVYDINKKNERRALRLLHIKKNPSLKSLCIKSEALFFATPDDEISKAYRKVKPFINGKKFIFHFSGLLSSAIFVKQKHIYRASIHPFATFPRVIIPPPRMRYFLFMEGDAAAKKAAKNIFPKKYFIIKNITKMQKANYHLLGVFSSNLMAGLLSVILELGKKMHWQEKHFYEVVYPMIEETLDNIKEYRIEKALSGPLRRGDIETVKWHLKALVGNEALQNTYKVLSLNLLQNIVKGKKHKEIEKLLRE